MQSSLNEFLEEKERVEHEGFVVDTDEKANWALRKIKQAQKQQKESNELADAEIEKIKAWNKSVNEKAQMDIDYFQSLLAGYALKKREENPKYKSQKLPNGRIKFVKQQPKYNYNDDLLIESLKKVNRTDLLKIKESPDKAAIKKSFVVTDNQLVDPDTGEFIEGVTVEQREDAFKVEVDDE